ncbi:MAG: tRNA (5-methylaminomethyl-2-thiouridine)(34)-methyltransferase MnmD, partial [Marinirhabdus sp.]
NPGVAKTAILEIGFGTGLNALLTLLEAEKTGPKIHYTGIDAFPLPIEEAEKLNYPQQLKIENGAFRKLHNAPWGASTAIGERFILTKQHKRASEIGGDARFNLIYFDAFGPRAQPALWTVSIFEHMYRALQPKGTLVTYSAKGSVRRAMGAVGFVTERLPGPPGKREMLRATKH